MSRFSAGFLRVPAVVLCFLVVDDRDAAVRSPEVLVFEPGLFSAVFFVDPGPVRLPEAFAIFDLAVAERDAFSRFKGGAFLFFETDEVDLDLAVAALLADRFDLDEPKVEDFLVALAFADPFDFEAALPAGLADLEDVAVLAVRDLELEVEPDLAREDFFEDVESDPDPDDLFALVDTDFDPDGFLDDGDALELADRFDVEDDLVLEDRLVTAI